MGTGAAPIGLDGLGLIVNSGASHNADHPQTSRHWNTTTPRIRLSPSVSMWSPSTRTTNVSGPNTTASPTPEMARERPPGFDRRRDLPPFDAGTQLAIRAPDFTVRRSAFERRPLPLHRLRPYVPRLLANPLSIAVSAAIRADTWMRSYFLPDNCNYRELCSQTPRRTRGQNRKLYTCKVIIINAFILSSAFQLSHRSAREHLFGSR